MDAGTLHDAIAEVCPVASVTVGDGNDRATWSFVEGEGATQPQIDAGNNIIATIPIETLDVVATGDFIARFTNAEYLALEKKRAEDIAANKVGNAKNWDNVTSDQSINMNKKKVQTLKADLVADGILTQARADAIFQ
jgi:hypothetical protein